MSLEDKPSTDRLGDNRTHHLVMTKSGNHRCVYCKKYESEIGYQPTTKHCAAAP